MYGWGSEKSLATVLGPQLFRWQERSPTRRGSEVRGALAVIDRKTNTNAAEWSNKMKFKKKTSSFSAFGDHQQELCWRRDGGKSQVRERGNKEMGPTYLRSLVLKLEVKDRGS